MANPWAGEVTLVIDGQARVMRLTLGALAELEQELGAGSLVALVQRFESGGFSGADLLALLAAGLRGGGCAIDRDGLGRARIEGGPVAAVQAGAQLLARAFSLPEGA